MEWHALSNQLRTDYVKTVQLADLELSDSPVSSSMQIDTIVVFKIN